MDGQQLATASATDEIRKFAALKAVFTAKDLEAHYGTKSMRPIAQRLAHNGELMLHAQGVYSVPGIASNDRLVKNAIRRTSAKPLPAEKTKQIRQAILDRNIIKTSERIRFEDACQRARRWIRRRPVFLRDDFAEHMGSGFPGVLARLVETGEIAAVHDGIYTKAGIDPLGPEVIDMINERGRRLAALADEIEEARESLPNIPVNLEKVRYSTFHDGHKTRVYISIPGFPRIYGYAVAGGMTRWKCAEAHRSKELANSIAQRIFPVPPRFTDLMRLIHSADHVPAPAASPRGPRSGHRRSSAVPHWRR